MKPRLLTSVLVNDGCYVIFANGQPLLGGKIDEFIEVGGTRGMRIEIVVHPADVTSMLGKLTPPARSKR